MQADHGRLAQGAIVAAGVAPIRSVIRVGVMAKLHLEQPLDIAMRGQRRPEEREDNGQNQTPDGHRAVWIAITAFPFKQILGAPSAPARSGSTSVWKVPVPPHRSVDVLSAIGRRQTASRALTDATISGWDRGPRTATRPSYPQARIRWRGRLRSPREPMPKERRTSPDRWSTANPAAGSPPGPGLVDRAATAANSDVGAWTGNAG
jgi:hypothetical protein